jgi:CO dehydrogenase maturation factor
MKICVCGKGGSGKSTVAVLLAQALKRQGKDVIVLDSDESNANLFWMLGFDRPPRPLMDLVGGKTKVQQRMIAGFTKGEGEPAMTIWEKEKLPSHEIPSDYVLENQECKLVATGKIHQSLEGCACPMGAVTREFLRKLHLGPDEVAVVDMEAGVEHFGRGVEASVQAVLCVVEPSLESVSLARKVMDLTQTAGASFKGSILNKVASDEQQERVTSKLAELGVPVVATIRYDNEIQSACLEGSRLQAPAAVAQVAKITDDLLKKPSPHVR